MTASPCCPERRTYIAISARLSSLTGVPPGTALLRRRRHRTAAVYPPEDLVRFLKERAGLSRDEVTAIWRKAAVCRLPAVGDDPYYCRWWTHRCAALCLEKIWGQPIGIESLPPEEINSYAALLWPLVLAILRPLFPWSDRLHCPKEDYGHLVWNLVTAYVPICITVYAADRGRFAAFLNAAVEEPNDPWRTIESAFVPAVEDLPPVLSHLYAAAVEEVDTPFYAPRGRRPSRCPTCHQWCGWDGVCRRCHPSTVPQYNQAWKQLEAYAPPATPDAVMLVLKSHRGSASLAEAEEILHSLKEKPPLSDILRKAGFSFTEAQTVLNSIRKGYALRDALERVHRQR